MLLEKTKKIFVIDDDEICRKTMTIKLGREGYNVQAAASAEQGLPLIKEFKPDLLFLDVVLPGKDGRTFSRELRQDPETAEIYTILLTGLEDTEDQDFKVSLANDVFMKPISLNKMAEKLRELFKIS